MKRDEATDKEAKRTLNRIKGTLTDLEDGSAWKNPMNNDEFKWMKNLFESGYHQPVLRQQLLMLLRHPVFLVFMLVIAGLLINWFLE